MDIAAKRDKLLQDMQGKSFGPYLSLEDVSLRLISVFDDLKFDRSDADMLSPPMRRHVVEKLEPFGFRQIAGTVLEQREADTRAFMPKFHALGASPFHITHYTERRPQDFYILTPTQTACFFIDHYPPDEAIARIEALVKHQPINLLRLVDFLERKPTHEAFKKVAGYIRKVQRIAVSSEPLMRRRALR